MTTDPIADLLTRIRNVLVRNGKTVEAPYSKIKEEILKVLQTEGFIKDYKVIEEDNKKNLKITLKYVNRKPMIQKLVRISKPGVRTYVSCKDMPRVKRGLGIAIVTTSRGVMSDGEARKQKVGGELICKVW